MVQERRVQGGPSLIPQAQGAEIDSAALMPQSAPFLASANTNGQAVHSAENVDVLYGQAAFRDAEPVQKTKTVAFVASGTQSTPASGIIYQVAAGETIQSISTSFGVPISMIVEFNPSVNFSSLIPGVSIVIPGQNDL